MVQLADKQPMQKRLKSGYKAGHIDRKAIAKATTAYCIVLHCRGEKVYEARISFKSTDSRRSLYPRQNSAGRKTIFELKNITTTYSFTCPSAVFCYRTTPIAFRLLHVYIYPFVAFCQCRAYSLGDKLRHLAWLR